MTFNCLFPINLLFSLKYFIRFIPYSSFRYIRGVLGILKCYITIIWSRNDSSDTCGIIKPLLYAHNKTIKFFVMDRGFLIFFSIILMFIGGMR